MSKMEDKSIARVATWLYELCVDVDVESFASRIKIQKFTYLLEKLFGEELYGDFRFFTKGPYSIGLEEDYYANKQIFGKGGMVSLNENEKREIERLKGENVGSLEPRQLEVMASPFYMTHEEKMDEETAMRVLKKRRPYLELEEIVYGLNKLKELMLTENDRKRLLLILKKETESFEEASLSDLADSEKAS